MSLTVLCAAIIICALYLCPSTQILDKMEREMEKVNWLGDVHHHVHNHVQRRVEMDYVLVNDFDELP